MKLNTISWFEATLISCFFIFCIYIISDSVLYALGGISLFALLIWNDRQVYIKFDETTATFKRSAFSPAHSVDYGSILHLLIKKHPFNTSSFIDLDLKFTFLVYGKEKKMSISSTNRPQVANVIKLLKHHGVNCTYSSDYIQAILENMIHTSTETKM